MKVPDRIGRLAVLSLFFAAALVVAGKLAELTGAGFWGGLLAAFGEAALVGGLADWFAVRALFAHPFGIPFPHTALIPRNRKRIIREIRDLVERQWLPRPVLVARVQAFDFAGQAVVPALRSLRPQLGQLLRDLATQTLQEVDVRPVAEVVARGLGRAAEPSQVATFAADLVRRAREQGWLTPVIRDLIHHLGRWVESPTSQKSIHQHLEHAAREYRDRGLIKDFFFGLGELFGGIDLEQASRVIQAELRRFAAEQLGPAGQFQDWLKAALTSLEQRLHDDPEVLAGLAGFLDRPEALARMVEPALAAMREEAVGQVQREDSPWLALALRHLDAWLDRLDQDAALRDRLNGWCRHLAVQQLERHHALLGELVEEQLSRLSDESLTSLIQERVGEDLNWIRLNGTFVGGLIGVGIYLAVWLVTRLGG